MRANIVERTSERLTAIVGRVGIGHKLHLYPTLLKDHSPGSRRLPRRRSGTTCSSSSPSRGKGPEAVGKPLATDRHRAVGCPLYCRVRDRATFALRSQAHSIRGSTSQDRSQLSSPPQTHHPRFPYPLGNLFGIDILELIVVKLSDSSIQNFSIGLIAKVLHKSALLCPKQIARSTHVKILHGKIETAAKLREILQCLKSAACLGSECRLRRFYSRKPCG